MYNNGGGMRVCVDLGELAEYAGRWIRLEAEINAKHPTYLNGATLTIATLMYAMDFLMTHVCEPKGEK